MKDNKQPDVHTYAICILIYASALPIKYIRILADRYSTWKRAKLAENFRVHGPRKKNIFSTYVNPNVSDILPHIE